MIFLILASPFPAGPPRRRLKVNVADQQLRASGATSCANNKLQTGRALGLVEFVCRVVVAWIRDTKAGYAVLQRILTFCPARRRSKRFGPSRLNLADAADGPLCSIKSESYNYGSSNVRLRRSKATCRGQSKVLGFALCTKAGFGARPPRRRSAPVEGKRIRTDETPLLAGFRISVGQNTLPRGCPHRVGHLRCVARSRGQNICCANETCGPTERGMVGGGSSIILGERVQTRK